LLLSGIRGSSLAAALASLRPGSLVEAVDAVLATMQEALDDVAVERLTSADLDASHSPVILGPTPSKQFVVNRGQDEEADQHESEDACQCF